MNGSPVKISIIIPVYNADKEYLRHCLKSALTQTFADIEVIAVNDGSDNGCEAVFSEYISDGRLKVITQPNSGTSVARNTGLDAAEGEYILFLDADDYLESGCCEKVLDFARENGGCDIIFFGYATEYTNTRVRRVLDKGALNSAGMSGFWQRDTLELAVLRGDKRLGAVEIGSPWGKLIKRSVIYENDIRYTPGIVKGQDTVFVLNLLEKCGSFKYLPVLGYHYRISRSSISHRYNPDIVNIMEKTLNAYAEFVEKNHKGAEFERAVEGKYYKVLTGEFLELKFVNKDNKTPWELRKTEFKALLKREEYTRALKAVESENLGFFGTLIYRALLRQDADRVFAIKRAELFARKIMVRQYG